MLPHVQKINEPNAHLVMRFGTCLGGCERGKYASQFTLDEDRDLRG